MRKLLIILSISILTACEPQTSEDSQGPKETLGTLTGAIVGGSVAHDLSEGNKNQNLITMLGIFTGAVMGNSIGETLDEMDRQLANMAYTEALETSPSNSARAWKNPDTGNYGSVTPTRTFYNENTVCREFTQKIIIGGKTQQGYGTACRTADGDWRIIN